ncbi:cupin domain-containing protein [Paenibacillus sp. FSL R7-0302]|uniref:cupin domain-containing protein n=1 Tax=Paenibacillus sp. FSL R7-0302 TaxID=2921681 RepID=UPI0030F81241
MTSYMDYTSPNTQFTFDMNGNTLFKKDDCNYINVLGIKNLNTLENTSLLDIYLSRSNVVEPHYHQNAAELVYCISGAAVVSLINPFTNELLHFPITPGQVANVPQGWWHYEVATVDCTHLLAIFDAPTPEVILGSDLLSLTPANVLAHTYCLNEALVKEALAPVKPQIFIGPPADCCPPVKAAAENMKGTHIAPANMAPMMANANMPSYMHQQQAPQSFGYQPMAVHGYYAQPYAQPYRQQQYVQAPPQAVHEAGTE